VTVARELNGGTAAPGLVLVVDDSRVNRKLLQRALAEEGHDSMLAEDGLTALRILAEPHDPPIDVVLLDLLMPGLDGFATLERIKAEPSLRHLPVIVISAIDDTESVARCIEMGATDYLPKPFSKAVLHARLHASLSEKRLRDLEREYLEQVAKVTGAAVQLEAGEFASNGLSAVAERSDALGQLARTFERMAEEVVAREQRLRAEVRELRIEIDVARQAAKVAEITDTDYFRDLRLHADDLRRAVRTRQDK
jgi:PleD family two-component response regulator